jgi:hypothetical protein
MQRKRLVLLALVLAGLALVAGCTASVRDDDPNDDDTTTVSGGGQAQGTPGFDGVLALAGVGAAVGLLALRRRKA